MSPSRLRQALYTGLLFLFLLHNDLWLWTDSSRVLGLPVGLTYHAVFCLAVTLLMSLLVRYAWPSDLAVEARDEAGSEP